MVNTPQVHCTRTIGWLSSAYCPKKRVAPVSVSCGSQSRIRWLSWRVILTGETKWSFWKLFKYSIEGILAYTTVPLYLSSIMGIIMCGVSFIALLFILVRAMIYGDPVAGWPSLVCIITLLGGMVLLALGIMGLYIAKIYLETKKRQIFIVREEA